MRVTEFRKVSYTLIAVSVVLLGGVLSMWYGVDTGSQEFTVGGITVTFAGSFGAIFLALVGGRRASTTKKFEEN